MARTEQQIREELAGNRRGQDTLRGLLAARKRELGVLFLSQIGLESDLVRCRHGFGVGDVVKVPKLKCRATGASRFAVFRAEVLRVKELEPGVLWLVLRKWAGGDLYFCRKRAEEVSKVARRRCWRIGRGWR